MNKLKFGLPILIALAGIIYPVKADEGMWLLQLMQEQHSIDIMKKQGLKLDALDIYNPNGVSLKDAVGIFGGGCTGEIISSEGLILTNHHCGYSSIQQHSSVEHDYLTDGFWTRSRDEELPTSNLTFTFIERIEDITDVVNAKIAANDITESESFTAPFLFNLAKELHQKSDLKDKKGIVPQVLPFYAGNSFYLIYRKVYADIRMVAAPPSSIGRFGDETDNWMWPRHTGDFSIFRIYADKEGEPASYSLNNVPLKTKKHLSISIKGIEEDDYTMIMGFPGSTSRYLTVSEVKERMETTNSPRIRIREVRQAVLKEEMNASDKIRIQYANKYAGSSNYWKNSIGMNKAIIENGVLDIKAEQEENFARFAREQNNADYLKIVKEIDALIAETQSLKYQRTCIAETFRSGIEFRVPYALYDEMAAAIGSKDTARIEELKVNFTKTYERIHNKDYDHEVDRKVLKVLFPLYADMIAANQRPDIYNVIEKEFKGDYNRFVDEIYDNSIMANPQNLDNFIKKPTIKALEKDYCVHYRSVDNKYRALNNELEPLASKLDLLHKVYVRGLGEMKLPTPSYPDANFSMRLAYGNIKSYNPRDGVHYKYFTTTNGVLEKEDPTNREFQVSTQLKELIEQKDFGRYALPNGEMPVCFLSTNDITGGNSGSPVLNENGELIGCAFDGNWESLSGDIKFDDNLQRCINLDIRYMLFILEKLGNCGHLIEEMTIVG
ncbi:Dipeptidyl-peptidase 7 [termite gut metagenome]|uniref:Dipeptidyl-peptidase 7 n=1 Tax=termite gut metagenome TaxID=433724 RepID=A0A5J4RDM7_9ZZZZ